MSRFDIVCRSWTLINSYFKSPHDTVLPTQHSSGYIRFNVHLPHPARGEKDWVLLMERDKCGVYASQKIPEQKEKPIKEYNWSPNSHMIDYYTLDATGPQPIHLSKGQVVGVILVDCFSYYLHIYYDPIHGLKVDGGLWNYSEEAKRILHKDILVGLEVLWIREKEVVLLQESNLSPLKSKKYDVKQYVHEDD